MASATPHVTPAIDSHNCPRLAGRCTEHGDHDIHEAPLNVLAHPFGEGQEDLAYSVVYEVDGTDLPRLAVGFGNKSLDLDLHQVDQLRAALRDFSERLGMQALHLAAAVRQAEGGAQ